MFTARGILEFDFKDIVYEIQFKEGVLTGDFPLVTAIQELAEKYSVEGRHFSLYTPSDNDYTKDGIAVAFIMQDVCRKESVKFKGKVPTLPYEEGLIY